MKLKELWISIIQGKNGKYFFLMIWFAFIILAMYRNIKYDIGGLSYLDWGVSDWLINYEDGFVRRGLPGQIIYVLYYIHPFNILKSIVIISMISSMLLLIIVLNIFIKKGWSTSILPLGSCFFFIFLAAWIRKDSILLLLAYSIFILYRKFLTKKSFIAWLGFTILSVILILTHEASFFFCFPILIVYSYSYISKEHKNNLGCRYFIWTKILLPFIPVFMAMLAVCIFKGDSQTPNVIWSSWSDVFKTYPDNVNSLAKTMGKIGSGVSALSWKLFPTMKYHATLNLFGTSPIQNPFSIIIGLPGLIWMFCAYYYIVTRLNAVKIGHYSMVNNTEYEISNTLLAQFVFMIPMFTVLSCDFGRTIPYWVLSTLMAVECFGKLEIRTLDKCTNKLQTFFRNPILKNPVVYSLIIICIPLTAYYAPTTGNALQLHYLSKIVHFIIAHIS